MKSLHIWPRFILIGILLSSFINCKSHQNLESESLSSPEGSLTKQFFEGLSSSPGTMARKRSGEILEDIFKEKLYPNVPKNVDQYTKEGQDRMRRILDLTVEYLKSGKQCSPSQRIRVYRGLGSQNVMIHSKGQEKQGVHIFTDWNNLLVGEVGGGKFGNQSPVGVRVFDKLAEVKKSAIENLDWAYFFGMKRQVARSRDPNDFINFSWEQLASTHSISSVDSPLISVALQSDVSNGFGPGFIVADICPERALPLESHFAFGETEVYVPLFILPEEVVRVEGLECGVDIQNGRSRRERCFPKPLTDKDPVSEATQGMKNCYINFGQPIEYKPGVPRTPVVGRYTGEVQANLKSIFEHSEISQVRQAHAKVLNLCSPSCQVSQSVVDSARKSLGYPPSNEASKKEHKILEDSLKDYLSFLKGKCPEVK
jgi:hypothetical protein